MRNIRRKTTLALIFALSLCANLNLSSDAKMSKESLKLYQSAQKFENQNRYHDAIDLMEKLLSLVPPHQDL